ncbi:MAG: PAS domain-containing protein [Sphaerotilus natans]
MPNAAASVAVPVPAAAAVLSPALLEALSDPVLVLAPDGRLERLNRAALRRLALEPGTALADLRPALGERLHARLCAALLGEADVLPGALSGEAADAATLAPLEAGRWALVMPLSALPETAGGAQAALPPVARTELALREQVERLTQERRQWFDSVPIGLVIFDAAGLVLQSNPRFAQLAGEVPVDLGEAGAALRDLLGWPGESLARLQPGDGNWWVREREFDAQQPGLQRWLRARVRCSGVRQGLRRYLGLIEDCSAEYRRDQAEQTLEDLHGILESSPVGIASLRGFRVAHCNRRFERMLRVPAGEALGADIRRLLAAGTGEAADTAYDEDGPIGAALADGGLHETEIEVRGDDGQTHWHALSIRRIGPSGEAPQAIAVLSEITRRKAQQAELEHLALERERMALALGQQADRTRAVLDSVLVGIVTADERGRILWLNRSARRMFGGDLGDFLGRPLDIVATTQASHPFRRTVALFEALRDGEAVQFECQVQACDGRTFWIVGNAVATQGLDGRREMTFAMMDIDQRRQAEARIAEAQASLQRIIEAAPMAIAVCDAATMAVQQLNHVAAGLCGVTAPEQAIGRTPEDLYPPELAQRLRADFDAALAQPQGVTQREYMLRRKGLDEVWDARFLPLARGAGRVDQLLMVATDVSAQRAAQKAELEAAIAQREMLVQEVHHRIKNNLQGVAGLMQQAANRRPEVRPLIAEVVGQVQAIAQVYGLQVGNTGLLAVRSVVEAIAQSVQRTFGHAIALEVEQAGDAPAAPGWVLPEAESIPIALTLNELFTNAVKHSASAEPVGCRLALQATGVEIVIRNAGRLHEGFRIDHRPATVSGLGLVRALLPRRHASLTMDEQGGAVRAIVRLAPPVVRSSSPESSPDARGAAASGAHAAARQSQPSPAPGRPTSATRQEHGV